MELNLDEIRVQIDELDKEILELFCKRMDVVKKVAAYKIANNMQVLRPERENIILERVEAEAEEGYGEYARDLFENIMRVSREMQQKMIDANK